MAELPATHFERGNKLTASLAASSCARRAMSSKEKFHIVSR